MVLTKFNSTRLLFYPRDAHRRNHIGTKAEGGRVYSESTNKAAANTHYGEWADTMVGLWEPKFAFSRRGYSAKRFIGVTMDLHVTNKLIAGNLISKYLGQGGAVYTDTLTASQRWSRDGTRRPWRPKVERDAARLTVVPSTAPAQGASLPASCVDNTSTRAHVPTGVVVTYCSRCHSPAIIEYHMELSRQTQCTLDEHLDQRSAAVKFIRDKMIDSLLHLGPEPPVECFTRLLRQARTEEAHVALYSPQAAARAIQTALDAGKRVIKGEIDLGMCTTATTQTDQGTRCLTDSWNDPPPRG